MSAACLIALFGGALLGVRYKIYVLLPASLATIILVATVQMLSGGAVWPSVIACASSVALLQAGFVASSITIGQRWRPMRHWTGRVGISDPAI